MSEEKKKSSSAPLREATEDGDESIEELRKNCDEYLCGWKRAKADYENLKKETERERKEFADWAREDCLLRLLPAFDQYEVALQFTPDLHLTDDKDQKAFDNWMIGLEAVRSLWREAAEDLGLKKIPANGAFDPELHEAVGEEENEDVPAGDIIRVMANGYTMNDKVVRPAKVIISGQKH